jgi:hypothetical protein
MNDDTNCDEVEDRLDTQIMGPDVARTIRVEVFGPFGLHQDEQEGLLADDTPSEREVCRWLENSRGGDSVYLGVASASHQLARRPVKRSAISR